LFPVADATNPERRGLGAILRLLLSWLSLSQTRTLIRVHRMRGWAFDFALLYAIVSMILGGMLDLSPVHQGFAAQVVYAGSPWWDYPWLYAVVPGMFLTLPLLPVVAMILVSVGAGLGTATALLLIVPRFRRLRRVHATEPGVGASAAVAPAITGLATMGACCCTSCAGTVGIAVIAAASGTDMLVLLRQGWYLELFQLVVVGVALLAQERALRVSKGACATLPKMGARFAVGVLLRISLLIAGITWSLAMFVEWIYKPPLSASAFTWYHWIFEHQVLSLVAIVAGLFPNELAGWIQRVYRDPEGWALRLVLLDAGITWGIWVPPVLTGLGLGGLINEMVSFYLVPASWGAVAPDSPLGPALLFHWIFQHALLAGFAILLAVRPKLATEPLLRTVAGSAVAEAHGSKPAGSS
jgi:hypothetical protein